MAAPLLVPICGCWLVPVKASSQTILVVVVVCLRPPEWAIQAPATGIGSLAHLQRGCSGELPGSQFLLGPRVLYRQAQAVIDPIYPLGPGAFFLLE